jgi:hypothetical protein
MVPVRSLSPVFCCCPPTVACLMYMYMLLRASGWMVCPLPSLVVEFGVLLLERTNGWLLSSPRPPQAAASAATGWRDRGFAVAFLLCAGTFVISAGMSGVGPLLTLLQSAAGGPLTLLGGPHAVLLVLAPVLSLGLSLAYLALLKAYAREIIKWTLLGTIAFNAVVGLGLLVLFGSFGGLAFLMAAVFTYWWSVFLLSTPPSTTPPTLYPAWTVRDHLHDRAA